MGFFVSRGRLNGTSLGVWILRGSMVYAVLFCLGGMEGWREGWMERGMEGL